MKFRGSAAALFYNIGTYEVADMKREMRRKDRMISEEECLKALEEAEYGSLATISEDGTPYITPLNKVQIRNGLRNGRCCERRCRKTKCHRSAGVKNQSGSS